jgi:hypothetical protein
VVVSIPSKNTYRSELLIRKKKHLSVHICIILLYVMPIFIFLYHYFWVIVMEHKKPFPQSIQLALV